MRPILAPCLTAALTISFGVGCEEATVELHGLQCSSGECIEGYTCRDDTNTCTPIVTLSCEGDGVCWSEVTAGDACSIEGSFVPCGNTDSCVEFGCRTCSGGEWSACSGEDSCTLGEIQNCSACNDDCRDSVLNAPPLCGNSGCDYSTCDMGYGDADGLRGNGCECRRTASGMEVCDGLDNNCDGDTDDIEAFRLNAQCAQLLTVADGYVDTWGCDSTCVIAACESGHYDADGNRRTGCEYTCSPSSPGTETCDGEDNDCDGRTDNVSSLAADCTLQHPNAVAVAQ